MNCVLETEDIITPTILLVPRNKKDQEFLRQLCSLLQYRMCTQSGGKFESVRIEAPPRKTSKK